MLENLSNIQLNRINDILLMAEKYKWVRISMPNLYILSFKKMEMRINIYITKMTIGTCLLHPLKGKTQLFRKCVTMNEIEKIFNNPRIHTKKGYYTK